MLFRSWFFFFTTSTGHVVFNPKYSSNISGVIAARQARKAAGNENLVKNPIHSNINYEKQPLLTSGYNLPAKTSKFRNYVKKFFLTKKNNLLPEPPPLPPPRKLPGPPPLPPPRKLPGPPPLPPPRKLPVPPRNRQHTQPHTL